VPESIKQQLKAVKKSTKIKAGGTELKEFLMGM
jgi:hypothetical protein